MKKKRMITLLFSLFIVVVCNNSKAMVDDQDRSGKVKRFLGRTKDALNRWKRGHERDQDDINQEELKQVAAEFDNLLKNVDEVDFCADKLTECEKDAKKYKKERDRALGRVAGLEEPYNTYTGGLAIAGGAQALLHYTKGKNEILNLVYSGTGDSKKLQTLALFNQKFRDDPFNFFKAPGIGKARNKFKNSGAQNVLAEVAISCALRLLWRKAFAKRAAESDNFFVKKARGLARGLPEPIKEVSQDIVRLVMVRAGDLGLQKGNPFKS